MNNIRIAVCDDEILFCENIKKFIIECIKKKGLSCNIDTFLSGKQLIDMNISEYDAIFLDVQIGNENGMDIAKNIREINKDVYIVFISAYNIYSAEGYKYNAVRYILKNDLSVHLKDSIDECINEIFIRMRSVLEQIVFSFKEGRVKLWVSQIIYVESSLHKLLFHLKNKKSYTLYEKLDSVAEQLNNYGFVRVHQSYLVNSSYIDDIVRYRITLSDGSLLPVAKSKFMYVRKMFITQMGEL